MLHASWDILLELSPWLLLGMFIAGLMHVLIPADFVRRKFRGPWGVVRAVAIGVPLPLCSCGVIPAGIGIKNDGADDGAAIGFLVSTPQTGVDSVLVSMSFFGWPFAIFKMLSALVMGIAGGLLTNWWQPEVTDGDEAASKGALNVVGGGSCCSSESEKSSNDSVYIRIQRGIAHALEIFQSIWLWMLVGVLLSAAISTFVPDQWIQGVRDLGSLGAMLIVLVLALPLYVCATASVPIAAALVAQGFPVSSAMVFLMAGPASNLATVGSVYGRFGIRPLVIYLGVVSIGSIISALVFDWLIEANPSHQDANAHVHGSPVEVACSVIVIGLTVYFALVWTVGKAGLFTGRTNEDGSQDKKGSCC